MSTTSKSKILLITVIILLITNIVMLFFFLNKGPEKRGRNGREAMMTEFLKKEIGFSAEQMQQYDTLSKQHREKVRASFDEIRTNKTRILKELGTVGFSDSAINASANISAETQKNIELNMLMHFATIRKLCTVEQLPKFDSLFYKVLSRRDDNKKPANKK